MAALQMRMKWNLEGTYPRVLQFTYHCRTQQHTICCKRSGYQEVFNRSENIDQVSPQERFSSRNGQKIAVDSIQQPVPTANQFLRGMGFWCGFQSAPPEVVTK